MKRYLLVEKNDHHDLKAQACSHSDGRTVVFWDAETKSHQYYNNPEDWFLVAIKFGGRYVKCLDDPKFFEEEINAKFAGE